MILVSQAPCPLPDDGDDIIASTRHALAHGFTRISLPPALMTIDEVHQSLADTTPRHASEPAIWIGTMAMAHALMGLVRTGLPVPS